MSIGTVIKNLDQIILSVPLAGCAVVGTGMSMLEQSSYSLLKKTGWLGSRSAIAGAVVCGVPLVVYSVVKLFFAAALNNITFKKIKALNSFQDSSEKKLFIVLSLVGVTPLVILNAGPLVGLCFKAYKQCKNLQASINALKISSQYQELNNAYNSIKNYLSSGKVSDELNFSSQGLSFSVGPVNLPVNTAKMFDLFENKYGYRLSVLEGTDKTNLMKLSETIYECFHESNPNLFHYLMPIIQKESFQLNPQAYMQNWKIERGHTEERRPLEDPALAFLLKQIG